MAIKDWSWGQLAVYWGFVVVAGVIIYAALDTSSHSEQVAAMQLVFVVCGVVGLVVTWRWFAGQKEPPYGKVRTTAAGHTTWIGRNRKRVLLILLAVAVLALLAYL